MFKPYIREISGRIKFPRSGGQDTPQHFPQSVSGVRRLSHPRARFLKFNGLAAMVQMDLPEEIHGPEIVDMTMYHFKEMMPIHQWILDALG